MTCDVQETKAWADLKTHAQAMQGCRLETLFAQDPMRATRWVFGAAGLTLDLSYQHVTEPTVALLLALARAQGVEARRDQMFAGAKINTSENRSVLHTALRDRGPLMVEGQDVRAEVIALHVRMKSFVEAVRSGAWRGASGKAITDIVNIGIGGSDLGPRLAAGALADPMATPRAHFVANVDAADLGRTLAPLDPATTLFVVVSKTFTTQETLLNARSARAWLTAALGEDAVARHFVAVSTNLGALDSFGIDSANAFPMWDWVGGRYSVWSAVGLTVALALGWEGFVAFLDGAAAMDAHFRATPLEQNLPVLMALTGIWYRNFMGTTSLAILPYTERLRDLPRYLQQLEMESNGKSVSREGKAITHATAPVIFGECGSVGQHSFHQCLHQGTDMIPADFIGVRASEDPSWDEHHAVLLAHLRAQATALAFGRRESSPERTNPGNKPSAQIWLDRLDPYHLGLLLALYEHKVFVQGVIWDINSFDQWGVQLGKKLAEELLASAALKG